MTFWIIILAMLVASVLCVLLPLLRTPALNKDALDSSDVYRDQLRDIEQQSPASDQERESLEIRRAEIARRLLKETAAQPKYTSASSGKMQLTLAAFAAIIAIPALAGTTYYMWGSPGVPDFPLSARNSEKLEDKSIDEMVQIAERHLQKNPNDAKGWKVLADVYGRTQRPSDRANALQQIIRISGRDPIVLADLGEALTVAEGNVVKERAKNLFEEAIAANPRILKASVYLALATEQEGRFSDALAQWRSLSARRPDDAQWQNMTASRMADMNQRLAKQSEGPTRQAALANPTPDQVKAASKLPSSDRTAMIEGMVAGLAEKLQDEPDNFEGWARLIRSYVVLKKPDAATKALADARKIFSEQPTALKQLAALAEELAVKQVGEGFDKPNTKQGADG